MLPCRGDVEDTRGRGSMLVFKAKVAKKRPFGLDVMSPPADVRIFMGLWVAVHVCIGDLVICCEFTLDFTHRFVPEG